MLAKFCTLFPQHTLGAAATVNKIQEDGISHSPHHTYFKLPRNISQVPIPNTPLVKININLSTMTEISQTPYSPTISKITQTPFSLHSPNISQPPYSLHTDNTHTPHLTDPPLAPLHKQNKNVKKKITKRRGRDDTKRVPYRRHGAPLTLRAPTPNVPALRLSASVC
jgi:hypothetical protein